MPYIGADVAMNAYVWHIHIMDRTDSGYVHMMTFTIERPLLGVSWSFLALS
jgi:hypothetical protein|eukprot:COSAG01_NODE_13689_length_1547_cov_6.454420_1_plen_51_part_00